MDKTPLTKDGERKLQEELQNLKLERPEISKAIRGRVIATLESLPVKLACWSNRAINFSFGEYDKGTLRLCNGFPLESKRLIWILLNIVPNAITVLRICLW